MSDKSFANPVTDTTNKATNAEVSSNSAARNEAYDAMKDYIGQSKCGAPKDTLPNVVLHDSEVQEQIKEKQSSGTLAGAERAKEKTAPVKVPGDDAMNTATIVKEKPSRQPRDLERVDPNPVVVKEKSATPGNQPANEVSKSRHPNQTGYLPKN